MVLSRGDLRAQFNNLVFSLFYILIIDLCEIQAVYQVTVLLVLNFDGIPILHLSNKSSADAEDVKNTFIFNAFVMCQVSFAL